MALEQMIRNILVPTDYSDASLNALESAIDIARRNQSLLQILHVEETDGEHLGPVKLPLSDHAREVAEAMAVGILQKHGIGAGAIFQKGFAGPAIVQTAFEKKSDLIILGAHGASGMREQFIGTTAYYVVKYAHCPVLIIPEGSKWLDFKNILFPHRTSFGSFKRYEFIKAMSSDQRASIEIFALSVDSDTVEGHALELMTHRLNEGGKLPAITLSVQFREHKNIPREVLDRADRMQADLLVLSPAVDVINKQFFIGPFCQRIMHHAKMPVLYVR
ncbi:universal stress protein [Paraflavitalea soli]|uniref:Universal stress protein n=1 Tax=Paraflavitalea soli TaxID=2315862 RepID=A0A3B7MG66_9BACT|nr:universal stress protein [Paraflavitalea soli]AXY73344.1 universal stress protein [Paraflavitalea soli]